MTPFSQLPFTRKVTLLPTLPGHAVRPVPVDRRGAAFVPELPISKHAT